jgi:hypothetical protein
MTFSERAEDVRETLFARYDELNALWLEAEEQLTKLHIPQPVCYSYAKYDEDWRSPNEGWIEECLGLQKVKGKWRICHAAYRPWCEPEADWTPIIECSAQTRVEAARHLAGLRQAVVESAENFVPKVDDAIESLRGEIGKSPSDSFGALLAERAKLNGKAK